MTIQSTISEWCHQDTARVLTAKGIPIASSGLFHIIGTPAINISQ